MSTSFSSKPSLLLIKGAINLLILSALVITFFSLALRAYAQIPQTQLNIIQSFNDFCPFYYKWRKDSNAKQDSLICQTMGVSFSSFLMQNSPNGYTFWPTKASLASLAQKGLLMDSYSLTHIRTPQAFVNAIRTNPDLQAFISGTGNINKNIPQDSTFLSALWDYTLIIIDQPVTPTCDAISQSYYYSDIWPFVGPEILKEASQQLIHTTNIQTTYSALKTDGHCSLAALATKISNMANTANPNNTSQLASTYQVPNPNSTYQLEKNILAKVQAHFQGSQIHDVSAGLAWIMAQKNQMLVDDWVSFAVVTNPNALIPENSNIPNNNNNNYTTASTLIARPH